MIKRLLLIGLLMLPFAAWGFIKPVRLVAPELNGVTCLNNFICTDEPSRFTEATKLYEDSLQFVDVSVAKISHKPRVIFCATDTCFKSFGFDRAAAKTIGTFGIVISPRAWLPYYVRHEMIHHLQFEQLGNLKAWLVTPQWFMEGMAYSLSEDPRSKLSEPWEHYRSRFTVWYSQVGRERIWKEAGRL